MEPERVSGNIWAVRIDGKEEYVIRNPVTGQCWGLPVSDITPDDLRALADRIEQRQQSK